MKSAVLALALTLTLVACGNPSSSPAPAAAPSAGNSPAVAPDGSPAAASSAVVQPGNAKLGDRTKCPVSGEEFVVSNDSPKADYEGKTYYFCCASCVDTFKKDPTKYVH
ncbi:MAG TPA: YHS domain-containing protein [Polyangiaceae bacterium]